MRFAHINILTFPHTYPVHSTHTTHSTMMWHHFPLHRNITVRRHCTPSITPMFAGDSFMVLSYVMNEILNSHEQHSFATDDGDDSVLRSRTKVSHCILFSWVDAHALWWPIVFDLALVAFPRFFFRFFFSVFRLAHASSLACRNIAIFVFVFQTIFSLPWSRSIVPEDPIRFVSQTNRTIFIRVPDHGSNLWCTFASNKNEHKCVHPKCELHNTRVDGSGGWEDGRSGRHYRHRWFKAIIKINMRENSERERDSDGACTSRRHHQNACNSFHYCINDNLCEMGRSKRVAKN